MIDIQNKISYSKLSFVVISIAIVLCFTTIVIIVNCSHILDSKILIIKTVVLKLSFSSLLIGIHSLFLKEPNNTLGKLSIILSVFNLSDYYILVN
jgi:hypothetical protein